MFTSAGEYKAWFDAPPSDERSRRRREPAPTAVWLEVIARFPECRAEVALNPAVPLGVLEVLRDDDDEHVRWCVRANSSWLRAHPSDV